MLMNVVILTSNGVCLVDGSIDTSPLATASFCRLVACLLQLSQGPEGPNDETNKVDKISVQQQQQQQNTSMFVLKNRHVHLLQHFNLEIAAACWYQDQPGLPTAPAQPANGGAVTFLSKVFESFLAAHNTELIQQEVALADKKLEDLCLSYSVRSVVADSESNVDTPDLRNSSSSSSTVAPFQQFKEEYLVPIQSSWVESKKEETNDDLQKHQPVPPKNPKPNIGSRPLAENSPPVQVQVAISKAKKGTQAVGSGAAAAASLSSNHEH
jgi:hypothetical protein